MQLIQFPKKIISSFTLEFISCLVVIVLFNSCKEKSPKIIYYPVSTDSISRRPNTPTKPATPINPPETQSNPSPKIKESSAINKEFYYGEGSYISENEGSAQNAAFILTYSNFPGSNRPSLTIAFGDGTEMYFNATCEGEYFWCIRDGEMNEIGTMRIRFNNDGSQARISIKRNENSSQYDRYLSLIEGKIVKAF
jgi:hypothetical protein